MYTVVMTSAFGEFPYTFRGGAVVIVKDVSTAGVYGLSGPHLQRHRCTRGILFGSSRRESYSVWPGRFSDRYFIPVRS